MPVTPTEQKPQEVENPAPQTEPLTPLQEHFISRLRELMAKRAQPVTIELKDKLALRLLSRAVYATYMDCVANGVGDMASALLDHPQAKG